ncbi:ORF1167 [White spot syndrome virus]|uniref:ORF1167 n=1 Tax=White spot syndrome virus TaxID=342409 RepID=A0A2D3I790_9VIRU|nr:ORF1167 [White spot syndrome virus]
MVQIFTHFISSFMVNVILHQDASGYWQTSMGVSLLVPPVTPWTTCREMAQCFSLRVLDRK